MHSAQTLLAPFQALISTTTTTTIVIIIIIIMFTANTATITIAITINITTTIIIIIIITTTTITSTTTQGHVRDALAHRHANYVIQKALYVYIYICIYIYIYILHLPLYNPFHSGSYTEAPRIECRSRIECDSEGPPGDLFMFSFGGFDTGLCMLCRSLLFAVLIKGYGFIEFEVSSTAPFHAGRESGKPGVRPEPILLFLGGERPSYRGKPRNFSTPGFVRCEFLLLQPAVIEVVPANCMFRNP